MAEDTKEDEEPIITNPEMISPPYPNTPTFISWETIHLPSSFPTQSPILLSSDPTPLHTPPVTATPLIFPPNNHENLNFDHHHQDKKVKPKPKPKTVSFDSTTKEITPVFQLNPCWVYFQFKLPAILGNLFKFFVIKKRVFWSFGFPVLMVFLYFRRRRRRRREGVYELLGVIKEKDERIRCLLYQIARMNELLLATHHGVPPMISKAATSS